MKAWLKGGLIGFVLGLLLLVSISLIMPFVTTVNMLSYYETNIKLIDLFSLSLLFLPITLLVLLGLCYGQLCGDSFILQLLAVVFTWGLPIVGTIIGLIIGEIKFKKRK